MNFLKKNKLMKKISKLVLLFTLGLTGCSQEPPIEIHLGQNSYWGHPQLQITAIVDEISIQAIDVNRGGCTTTPQEKLPHELRFGNVLKVEASRCQTFKEVIVKTNKGDHAFTF